MCAGTVRGGPILNGRSGPVQLKPGIVAERPRPRRVQNAQPSAPAGAAAAAAALWQRLCSGHASWTCLCVDVVVWFVLQGLSRGRVPAWKAAGAAKAEQQQSSAARGARRLARVERRRRSLSHLEALLRAVGRLGQSLFDALGALQLGGLLAPV